MNRSVLRSALAARMCAAVVGVLTAIPALAHADGYQVESVTPWTQNAAPMGWSSSLNRVLYNVKGADGMFDAYSANPDGSHPQCLTCTVPSFAGVGTATNRGVSDVSPDGRYMLVEVEHPSGSQTGADYTQPGKGTNNDVWLETTDGSQAWSLTDITAPGQQSLGTMWARFDRTGTRIVWASDYAPAVLNLGYWQLKVADVVWTGGVPSLANVRTIEPQTGRFYEPYGFSPDDSKIIFASDANMPTWMDSQIDTINVDGTGLTRLSPADAPTGLFTDYNEFAFYTPDGNWIFYGRTRDATGGGLDYWIMRPDGTDSQRLTYFNSNWNTESLGYTVVGGLAFDPHDPNRVVVGAATDPNAGSLNAMLVTLAPSTAGLTQQDFSDTSFGRLVASTIANPSAGFEADGAPTSGMPTTNYSIRWSGSVTPPVAGTYTFCTVADLSDQLYVGGRLLVDGTWSMNQRRCATASESAGVPVSVRIDYEHSFGTADLQLSWIPPGATAPQLIPSAALAPAAAGTSPAPTAAMPRSDPAPGSGSAAASPATGTPPAVTARPKQPARRSATKPAGADTRRKRPTARGARPTSVRRKVNRRRSGRQPRRTSRHRSRSAATARSRRRVGRAA